MAGMCRPSPIILLLLLVVSTYGGPWNKLVPEAIASSSSAVMMDMMPQLRIELSIENCTVNGKFPIPESCETFYQCDDWDGLGMEMYQFTCPVGTIFDDHVSTCNFPSLIKSRPDCTSGEVQGNTLEEAVNFSIVHAGYEMESVDLATGNDYAVRELMLNTIRDRTKRSAIIEEDNFTEESNVIEEIDFTVNILGEEDNITAECKGNINEHNITEEGNNITDSDLVANKALHSCKQIHFVDEYVDMVTSMIPVAYPDFLKDVFNSTDIDHYNKILEAAQNHTYIWRHGDDIMSGFRRTYELAKLFGPTFQRKFIIAKRRLEMLNKTSNTIEQEEEIREDIEFILEDLDDYRSFLREDPSERNLKRYEPRIEKKERILAEKRETLRGIMAAVRDLDEIISFLEFVKKDAGKIQEKANMTMQKLKILKDNTLQDKTEFSNIIKSTTSSIGSAMVQLDEAMEHIKGKKKLIKQTEEDRAKFWSGIHDYEAKIEAQIQGLTTFVTQYHQKMDVASDSVIGVKYTPKKCTGWWFWRRCTAASSTNIRGVDHAAIKKHQDAMKVQNDLFDDVVSNYMEINKQKHSSLDANSKEIFKLQEDILKKGSEVRNLGRVEYYLNTVIEESERILPYIEDAILGLKDLEQTFENVVFKLEKVVTHAKEVQEPAQKRIFKELFYLSMDEMQINWNNSYSDIIDIGSCTDPDYYNASVEKIKATETPINSTSITELNCTTVIEPLTINDTKTTTTTTTEPLLLYIDFDSNAENFI